MTRPFGALALGLQEFEAELAGPSGQRIDDNLAQSDTGAIPGLIRGVLGAVLDMLTWLDERDFAGLLSFAGQTDSALAFIESTGALLAAIGEFEIENTPESVQGLVAPLNAVIDVVATIGNTLSDLPEALDILPAPEEVEAVQDALEGILRSQSALNLGDLIAATSP